MLRFIHTVNNCAGENRLEKDVLESVFDTWWPRLDSSVTAILGEYDRKDGEDSKVIGIRSDRELLEELLGLVRLMSADVTSSQDQKGPIRERPVSDRIGRIIERIVERPNRRHLPDERQSITHRFSVAGHEGVLTVGLYDDGSPGELFIAMTKEGSTVGGMFDAWASAIALGLQYGIPLIVLVDAFRHCRFEPSGMTANRDIPSAKSIVDYVFTWIGCQFVPGYVEMRVPWLAPPKAVGTAEPKDGTEAPKAE